MNADTLSVPTDFQQDTAQESDVDQVYLTQAGADGDVTVPPGQDVVRIVVIGGSTIRLPFSDDDLSARLGEGNGNLALKSDDTTVILLGYADALEQGGVTIVDVSGEPVDVAATLATTDPNIDIQTAAGAGAGDLGDGVDNSGGIFAPFDPQDGPGGFDSIGGLDPTALTYTVIEVPIVPIDQDDEGEEVAAVDSPGDPGDPGEPDTTAPVNYNDANSGDENIYRDTNVMVVLDLSGSMKEDANDTLAGVQSRISIAKAVLANLLHTYETLGDVRVTIVTFNEGAEVHFTWGSVADAIAGMDTLTPQDRTNYAAAVEVAETAWAAGGKLDGDTENVIYFLSDGKPTLGGDPGHHLTAAQKAGWDGFLENSGNGIDHVYAVGIGDDVGSEAAPDRDLNDVAHNGLPPGDVLYVNDPAADLAERLIDTIEGHTISGNVISGVNTSGDDDNGAPGQADAAGDGATHIYTLAYEGDNPAYSVEFNWDGSAVALTQVGAGGQNVSVNDLEVSFDTEHGRMTFDFASGGYVFTPGAVSQDTDVSFHYGTRDVNGDVDEPGGTDADGAAGGADLVISIVDVPAEPFVAHAVDETSSASAMMAPPPLDIPGDEHAAFLATA